MTKFRFTYSNAGGLVPLQRKHLSRVKRLDVTVWIFFGDGAKLNFTVKETQFPIGNGTVRVCIDSVRSANGVSRTSDFAARLDRFGTRNGLFTSKEPVVLSDGAAWIRNICERVFAGRNVSFILDQYHALEYAAATVRALVPDKGKRKAWIKLKFGFGRIVSGIAAEIQ